MFDDLHPSLAGALLTAMILAKKDPRVGARFLSENAELTESGWYEILGVLLTQASAGVDVAQLRLAYVDAMVKLNGGSE